jgi:hypothetical protein
VWRLTASLLLLGGVARGEALQASVYATAGGILQYLTREEGRQQALEAMRRLHISRVFLEGRRGDEYVPAELLAELRDYFAARGIATTAGIATVPGANYGVRQNEKLGWLNWEAEKTQNDIRGFFRENAAIFDELIVDDFFCTGDTSAVSVAARGERTWAEYRQALLTRLAGTLMIEPARKVNPNARLIIKYPQWYDRFHLFGYNPAKTAPLFDQVWVGTEVRNPATQRMGFVQPTQGYMNFRWIASIGGEKVVGAWFDHIESTAQNVVDQAYQSVLAGAREITYFHLGDLMEGHPSHALLARAWEELKEVAVKVRGAERAGVAVYKPAGSDSDDNMYLMDYLGMLGIPVVPASQYPGEAKTLVLGVQAASDTQLLARMKGSLRRGAVVVITPALLRKVGAELELLAGVRTKGLSAVEGAREIWLRGRGVVLDEPVDVEHNLAAADAELIATAVTAKGQVPWLTVRRRGAGRILLWNIRTFSEDDFRETGEWLLPPKKLGLAVLRQEIVDELRARVLAPLGILLSAPAGGGVYLAGNYRFFYNFRAEAARLRWRRQELSLKPNQLLVQAAR